ncbi:MAG TPA: Uma2 family endonuclease [Pseudonocardiaceae bacterium]|jgi:Uma2 family endonuclease|nr:Uma2 family endonuclease [Pseudonocardiaceae bacterium]
MSAALADQEAVDPVLSHNGPWTIEDIEALPDCGNHTRYELLTPGVLTVSPAPGTLHQRASRRLACLLDPAVSAAGIDAEVLEAVNVVLPDGRLAIPDVLIVEGKFADANPTKYPPEAVIAVIEIVSPGSEPQDRMVKPQVYAKADIGVYWRFELEPKPHILAYELRRGRFVHVDTAPAGERTTIPVPFPVEVDPLELTRR